MTNEEANKVLEELHEVRPEKLNDKAKRLFEAIMEIADERDSVKADLYEANNRIDDLLDTIKLKEEQIEYIENEYGRTIEQKDKIIDEIILYIIRHNYLDTTEFDKNIVPTIENIKKYFEERCK